MQKYLLSFFGPILTVTTGIVVCYCAAVLGDFLSLVHW